MSHTVKIAAQFKTEHLNSFKRALETFGWKLDENAKMRTYGGNSSTSYSTVAVNPNNGYDIGIQFNEKTGEMECMGDFYDGSIAKTLGNNLDKLKQEYSCCLAEDVMAYEGFTSTRSAVNEEGTVYLDLE